MRWRSRRGAGREMISSIATKPSTTLIAQWSDSSFSWYCRRPATDDVGTVVRMGDARLGLAAVHSALPACAGTAAATLLNMAMDGVRGLAASFVEMAIDQFVSMVCRGCVGVTVLVMVMKNPR